MKIAPAFSPARLAAVVPLVAVLLATGCVAEDPPDPAEEPEGSGEPAEAEREAYVPATRFDTSAAVTLQREGSKEGRIAPVALHEGTVYFTDSTTLHAHDAFEDKELWSFKTEYPPRHTDRVTHSASLVETENGPVVIGAIETQASAEGTAEEKPHLEVIAVDAESGDRLWHTVHESESGLRLAPYALGADGEHILVRYDGVRALDAKTGKAVWNNPDIRPYALQGGAVVGDTGEVPSELRAVSADTGEELWTVQDYDEHRTEAAGTSGQPSEGFLLPPASADPTRSAALYPAGSGRVAFVAGEVRDWTAMDIQIKGGLEPEVEYGTLLLIDAETGAVEHTVDTTPEADRPQDRHQWGDSDCAYDGKDTLVCWENTEEEMVGTRAVAAVDTDSGEVRWVEEFGEERPMIDVTGVGQGALYAEVSGEPVTLSLEDGSDLATEAGAAPDLTNGFIAVTYGEDGALTVHPVVG